jgi:hypothetical protein
MKTVEQVANRLVELCREQKYVQAVEELYAENSTSNEPAGTSNPVTKGYDAVRDNVVRFVENTRELTDLRISDPIIADNFFSITMKMNCRMEGVSFAMPMDEVCVYHVLDGKIVNEHFFHTVITAE